MSSNDMFDSIDLAITQIQKGGLILVADDDGPDNEGSLIGAAEHMTAAHINFMLRAASGMLCVSMPKERAEHLQLPLMVDEDAHPNSAAFTVTVDAGNEFGVSSGVSASDRAMTIQRLAFDKADAQDFRRPGHVSPLQAKAGGVLRRVGHTEAAMDFARLSGSSPVGVLCEVLNEDGSIARRDDLAEFARTHDLPFVTIAQLIAHRMQRESYVQRKLVKEIETKYGTFTAVGYKDTLDGIEHLALVKGSLDQLKQGDPLVRVQHENMIADVFGHHEDAHTQHLMAQAMNLITKEGSGVVVYLRHTEDSHQGLINSLKQYNTSPAEKKYANRVHELRDYGVGAQILVDLGVSSMRVLNDCTYKIVGLQGYGLTVTENIQMVSGQFDFLPDDDLKAVQPQEKEIVMQHDAPVSTPASVPTASPTTLSAPVIAPSVKASTEKSEVTVYQPETDVMEQEKETPVIPFVSREETKKEEKPKTQANENQAQPVAHSGQESPEQNKSSMTMRMGGQVMSGQALFEG